MTALCKTGVNLVPTTMPLSAMPPSVSHPGSVKAKTKDEKEVKAKGTKEAMANDAKTNTAKVKAPPPIPSPQKSAETSPVKAD